MRPVLRSLVGATALVLLLAVPAAADAARPGDFRSEVTGLVPEVDGVTAEIKGGDAFLELAVDDGIEVVVLGYYDEPYLLFAPDGTVSRNLLAPSGYVNDDRQGGGTIPPEAQEYGRLHREGDGAQAGDPQWDEVGTGGTYAWHDHRTHWMQSSSPPVGRGEAVGGAYDPWQVPIVVDGDDVTIEGTLVYAATVSPVPWIAAAIVAAVVVVALGRRAPILVATASLLITSVLGAVTGFVEHSQTPDGGGNPLLFALPAFAAATALGGLALFRRPAGAVLALASIATLLGWAVFRVAVLLEPVLPTTLPPALDRLSVALAFGVAAGAAVLVVRSGALALPSLDDDDPTPATATPPA